MLLSCCMRPGWVTLAASLVTGHTTCDVPTAHILTQPTGTWCLTVYIEHCTQGMSCCHSVTPVTMQRERESYCHTEYNQHHQLHSENHKPGSDLYGRSMSLGFINAGLVLSLADRVVFIKHQPGLWLNFVLHKQPLLAG